MSALDEVIDDLGICSQHEHGARHAHPDWTLCPRCEPDRRLIDEAREELAAIRAENERLRKALEEIVQGAPTEKPSRGDWNGNADDDYEAGYELARWGDAETARSALSAKEAT